MRPALALAAAALLGGAGPGAAQGVLVAPHAVIIEHRVRSTAITIYNPGAEPAEVSIADFFGYPVTDSAGEFELATPDPVSGTFPSAAGWVEAYPRRMTLGPLERQTVRLLARPPAGLADGEYWSRLVITARGSRIAVAQPDSATGVEIGLDLEVRTIIPVQYRKGDVRTAVRILGVRAAPADDSLAVRVQLAREGNAAFVGSARLRLVDAANRVAAEALVPLAVYYEIDPHLALPISGLARGAYRLELELRTERTDLPPDLLIQAPPTRHVVPVALP